MCYPVSTGLWVWKQSKNGEWGEVIWVLYNGPFITGNWVVFLKVTTWLSKLNITNKAQPLCPFSGASRRIRHFLRRDNWQTAMVITEALSVLSSPRHIHALILSFSSLHLLFFSLGSYSNFRVAKNTWERRICKYMREHVYVHIRMDMYMHICICSWIMETPMTKKNITFHAQQWNTLLQFSQ